jgi:hypothetical protein
MIGGFLSSFFLRLLKLFGIAGWWKERGDRQRLEGILERKRKADEAAHDERKDTDGMSDADVADRVRDRTDEWTGL